MFAVVVIWTKLKGLREYICGSVAQSNIFECNVGVLCSIVEFLYNAKTTIYLRLISRTGVHKVAILLLRQTESPPDKNFCQQLF